MREYTPIVLKDIEIHRFWSKVAITANPNICWNWLGSKSKGGYGRFIVGNHKNKQANRIAYFIHNKTINNNLVCMHSCDNPSCVNPNHLSLGTSSDNAKDRNKKKRNFIANGEVNGNSKLKSDDVVWIRELHNIGVSCKKISLMFNVAQNSISLICRRQIWKHI